MINGRFRHRLCSSNNSIGDSLCDFVIASEMRQSRFLTRPFFIKIIVVIIGIYNGYIRNIYQIGCPSSMSKCNTWDRMLSYVCGEQSIVNWVVILNTCARASPMIMVLKMLNICWPIKRLIPSPIFPTKSLTRRLRLHLKCCKANYANCFKSWENNWSGNKW